MQPSLKICFLNQMDEELSNSWLFIQKHKVNGSAVLPDHKLCFPAALLKQNSPEKCKGNTTGDRKESELTSWRQQQCTCSSPVISAHCSPQKHSLQILLRGHCANLTYLYSHRDVVLNDTPASVYSNRQETTVHSFTTFFFSPMEETTGSHFTRLSPSLSYYQKICTTKVRGK